MGHDNVLQADGGDQVTFVFGDDDTVLAVEQLTLARDNDVVVLIGADNIGQSGEGAHIEPAAIQLERVNALSLFHHGIVDADLGQFQKPFQQHLLLIRTVPAGLNHT